MISLKLFLFLILFNILSFQKVKDEKVGGYICKAKFKENKIGKEVQGNVMLLF